MELACFDYDIIYRPGRDNSAADTLTRAFCNAVQPVDQAQYRGRLKTVRKCNNMLFMVIVVMIVEA